MPPNLDHLLRIKEKTKMLETLEAVHDTFKLMESAKSPSDLLRQTGSFLSRVGEDSNLHKVLNKAV